MPKSPTKTTNRIHFTDLDPGRFEDLCVSLLFTFRPWNDIRHYGRSGGDGGVDIRATETNEDGQTRQWIVQCRRLARAANKALTVLVDDALQTLPTPPDVLLGIVACDVRRKAHEHFIAYAASTLGPRRACKR